MYVHEAEAYDVSLQCPHFHPGTISVSSNVGMCHGVGKLACIRTGRESCLSGKLKVLQADDGLKPGFTRISFRRRWDNLFAFPVALGHVGLRSD